MNSLEPTGNAGPGPMKHIDGKPRQTIEVEKKQKATRVQAHPENTVRTKVLEFVQERVWEIEDLRNHSPEMVGRLRELLASDAHRRPDPHRRNFFEIEDSERVFYIHISSVSGRVHLLATWQQEPIRSSVVA